MIQMTNASAMAFQSSEQKMAMHHKVQGLLPFHVHHIGWIRLEHVFVSEESPAAFSSMATVNC